MKCYIVHLLKRNPSFAPTHVARYLQPMRWLSDHARGRIETLQRVNQRSVERLIERIRSQRIYGSDTHYQVARDVVAILNWTSRERLLIRTVNPSASR